MHEPLDEARLAAELAGSAIRFLRWRAPPGTPDYLMRPDLGRRLAADAEATLAPHAGRYDVAFVVADGSVGARRADACAAGARGRDCALRAEGWRIAPLVIVRHGRVAIGDAIAAALGAECVAILIGERPGLSAPTAWAPT